MDQQQPRFHFVLVRYLLMTLTVRFIEVTSLDLKTVKDWSNQTDPLKKTGLLLYN